MIVYCAECGQKFDLTNKQDAEDWYYGHDCDYSAAESAAEDVTTMDDGEFDDE
jgi:hypothetical protein